MVSTEPLQMYTHLFSRTGCTISFYTRLQHSHHSVHVISCHQMRDAMSFVCCTMPIIRLKELRMAKRHLVFKQMQRLKSSQAIATFHLRTNYSYDTQKDLRKGCAQLPLNAYELRDVFHEGSEQVNVAQARKQNIINCLIAAIIIISDI